MTIATINRFISLFHDAFAALEVIVPMDKVERMAMLVHHSMESKTRAYHTASHVFYMCDGMNPRQVLAALFHDVVYYQLDDGFPSHAVPLLADVARVEGDTVVVQDIRSDDAAVSLCADIFDFRAGQTLPLYGGMNEFLSAVVAARMLHDHVTLADLIAIVACIEATIPFRAPGAQGKTATDVLAQRVKAQYEQRVPALLAADQGAALAAVMKDAVQLANRDVGSFGEPDPGLFLSSTWLLIDESNAPLAAVGIYSLTEYRQALRRMDLFLSGLNPMHVFQCVDGYPDSDEMDRLCSVATRNIAFACDFLDSKITSTAIIEALALCTGTDCPISMFLGDIRSAHGKPDRVEAFLPAAPAGQTVSAGLVRVLERGRTLQSANDLTASPLTAFVYRYLGHEGTHLAMVEARKMFDGSLSPEGFLRALNRNMVKDIIRACAQIALSRREALLALGDTL